MTERNWLLALALPEFLHILEGSTGGSSKEFTTKRSIALVIGLGTSVALRPEQALAANFGFVRWPDYLDFFILIAAILTAAGFFGLKAVLPKGKSYSEVPKAERTTALKVFAVVTLLSIVALMGMIFIGMGLQRAAE